MRMRREKTLVFLIALSLRLALLVWWPQDVNFQNDEGYYAELGANIARGHGMSAEIHMHTGIRTGIPRPVMEEPLLPFLNGVSMFFGDGSLFPARLVHVALGAAFAWFLWTLGEHLFGRAVGRLAGWLGALYPPFLFDSQSLNKEPMLLFFTVAFAVVFMKGWALSSNRWFSLAGLLLGLSVLTRETMFYFPFVALAFIAFGLKGPARARMAAGVAFILGLAVPVAPWAYRNWSTYKLNLVYERPPVVATWQFEYEPLILLGLLSREVKLPASAPLPLASAPQPLASAPQPLASAPQPLASAPQPPASALNEKRNFWTVLKSFMGYSVPSAIPLISEQERARFIAEAQEGPEYGKAWTYIWTGIPDNKIREQYRTYVLPRAYGVPFGGQYVDTYLGGSKRTSILSWRDLLAAPHVYVMKAAIYAIHLGAFALAFFTLRAHRNRAPVWFIFSVVVYVAVAIFSHPEPKNNFFFPAVPFIFVLASPAAVLAFRKLMPS